MTDTSNQDQERQLIQIRFGNADVFVDGAQLIAKLADYMPAVLKQKASGRFDPLRFALSGMIAKELPGLKRQIAADMPGYPLPDPPRHTDLVAYMLDYYTKLILHQLAEQVIVLHFRRALEYGANAVEITGASSAPIISRLGIPAPDVDANDGPSAEAMAALAAPATGIEPTSGPTEASEGTETGASGQYSDGETVTPAGANTSALS